MINKELYQMSRQLKALNNAMPTLNTRQLVILLEVAKGGPLRVTDIATRTGLSKPDVSRSLSKLVNSSPEVSRLKDGGLGLVALEYDVYDRRSKTFTLTDKGYKVLADATNTYTLKRQ